ncbi:MAG: deoxyguanosinetriphosphate triphosphohydrolase [Ruminococcus flavefaciens]|nr:deoxyguanosinetriphosphate triphosphohydrolase [Ruminococcus flavefaciens]MCM1362921.1 deoxyguanosinetriphosphate triphosphohydrolase [Clostridiales bacterium]MCM1434996.1 deoxyguanosinetriphosphate triphosphohydrolase [Ruminococcus flavefaciens]
MDVREQTEMTEAGILSKYACTSTDETNTKRLRYEEKCPYRTEFQRDRDRILHCNSFRRLKRKTQVFLSPVGDHYRTRLTHTLEVSQIARTISRGMRMNEDLTEAIALGHDLGHSPFGHCGESVLNEICPHGFKHYLQSVRVVDEIEKNGEGLNLTYAVRNGIECHTNKVADTKEGNIVRLADTIAYINHDIEDSIRAGILKNSDLPTDCVKILGNTKAKRITTLIASVIEHGAYEIDFAPQIRKAHDDLRQFMFDKVYLNPAAKQEEAKAELLLKKLYSYFIEHTDKLPDEYRCIMKKTDADRAVCDYISGMSDGYAVDLYTELFVPKFWK